MPSRVRDLLLICLLSLAGCAAGAEEEGDSKYISLTDTQAADQKQDTAAPDTGVKDTGAVGEDTAGDGVQPGGFGWPCESNSDCDSGFCVKTDEGYICTVTCLEECPEDWLCRIVQNTYPDVVSICVPDDYTLCEPCEQNLDCGVDNLCLEIGTALFCGLDCSIDPCPEGYTCEEVEDLISDDKSEQCLPDIGICCTEPEDEVCDQLDNDCDGETDEDLEDKVDDCDDYDDDCDDETDEDYESFTCGVGGCEVLSRCIGGVEDCVPHDPAADDATCDGIDDDCDSETDEDWAPTSCFGVCAENAYCISGELHCGTPLTDTDYICNDKDDDCDGATDEDYEPDDTCGVGGCEMEYECVSGDEVCEEGTPEADDATCDDVDEDCDTTTDEDWQTTETCGLGACEMDNQCVGGEVTCTPGNPAPDDATCDGIDSDCDGDTDEDIDKTSDENHCGECNHACSSEIPSAPLGSTEPMCVSSACDYNCLGEYWDVNGQKADGCECEDTENYPQSSPLYLGEMNDNDAVYFSVAGKLPHDSKHTGPFEEWYDFKFKDDWDHDTEFYLVFRSAPGTAMKVYIYKQGEVSPMRQGESSGDVVKLSRGSMDDGKHYLVRIEWLSGNSCDQYKFKIGDGCCSDNCVSIACGFSCGGGCPSL